MLKEVVITLFKDKARKKERYYPATRESNLIVWRGIDSPPLTHMHMHSTNP